MSETELEGDTIAAPLLPEVAEPSNPLLDSGPKLLANRYELLGMLGAGGMGTVYRARDRELDEVVALKVLKVASTDLLERFRREVKLARRVTHKNVARTFDIGEDGGDRFLTMELIEGEMLAARLARKGRLPLNEVSQLARDVCAGLGAAHAANVLHRDLKPANIVVAKDGRAVITDFGIARAVASDVASRTVGIVGTPTYMAPEQVEGTSDIDARADLYALGVMLFELLTGERPWRGETSIAIAAARLLHPPPDPRTLLPGLASPVAELIVRLMARRPEDRPASAEEVAGVLASIALPSLIPESPDASATLATAGYPMLSPSLSPRPGSRIVAVLPIVNAADEDSYLIEGMLDDLVDNLSVVPELLIRPRGDTLRFTDPKREAREIGRTVNADVIVDASFRRVGDRVRASFRLIAVQDGFQLWAQRFDRASTEVLDIADHAAAAIAKALTAKRDEKKPPTKQERSLHPEAEDLYLRGRYLLRRAWAEYHIEACALLTQAHHLAPDDTRIAAMYALAVARTYGSPNTPMTVIDKARAVAEATLERDPSQGNAKVALGVIHLQNQEVDAAIRYFRQALAISPNGVEPLDWLGRIMAEVGRTDAGLAFLRRASAIDPENLAPSLQAARVCSILGDRAAMRDALGPLPKHPGDATLWVIVQARDCIWHRDRTTAEHLRQLAESVDMPPGARMGVEQMLAIARGLRISSFDDRVTLDRVLPVDATRSPRRASFNAQIRAEMFGSVGDVERTMESLRYADGNSLVDLVWLDRCPLFDALRTDTDFAKLRERVDVRASRVIAALDSRSPAMVLPQ